VLGGGDYSTSFRKASTWKARSWVSDIRRRRVDGGDDGLVGVRCCAMSLWVSQVLGLDRRDVRRVRVCVAVGGVV